VGAWTSRGSGRLRLRLRLDGARVAVRDPERPVGGQGAWGLALKDGTGRDGD
jgi:hypothetical protein